ncbi:MAG: TIGR04283 family arsenosugar biosynthesis glycosyltransferase [Ferruginibacter sp.]
MISIIIPTLNEAENIERLLPYLKKCCDGKEHEVIVSDCGSTDNTRIIAERFGAIVVLSSCKGRAMQMNAGAAVARFGIYYFVHADTLPPETFYDDIIGAVEAGYDIGRYRTKFDSNNLLLKLNAYFTRFDWFMCYGGDQTLFLSRWMFILTKGFNGDMQIMEEYDFVKRARQHGRYKIFERTALVSIRKYKTNSWLKVQRANYIAMKMFKNRRPQQEIIDRYAQLLSGIKK